MVAVHVVDFDLAGRVAVSVIQVVHAVSLIRMVKSKSAELRL